MREFVAPLPLAAVALMAVNDAFLKARLHDALTGKLSDIAVCFFLPLYLSALIGAVTRVAPRTRLLVGAAVTAALYAVLELSPAAAAAFCVANARVGALVGIHRPFRLTSDPTDLLALALVPAAYVYGMRRLGAGKRNARTPGRQDAKRDRIPDPP